MNWKIFWIAITILSALAFGLHFLSDLNFWLCLVLLVCATQLNGLIATLEDEWPGGFNNPRPEPGANATKDRVAKATEKWLRAIYLPSTSPRSSRSAVAEQTRLRRWRG